MNPINDLFWAILVTCIVGASLVAYYYREPVREATFEWLWGAWVFALFLTWEALWACLRPDLLTIIDAVQLGWRMVPVLFVIFIRIFLRSLPANPNK